MARDRDASVGSADATSPNASASRDGAVTMQGGADGPVRALDLLFVIDNSLSMALEQRSLVALLPSLIRVLTTGDRRPGEPPGDPDDRARYFPPVHSLHMGVITTELPVMKTRVGSLERCLAPNADDARLQRSVSVAADGQTAASHIPEDGIRRDDVLVEAREACVGRELERDPGYLRFDATDGSPDERDSAAAEAALSLGCLATVGVYGCAFEQQLEAMWKAVAPSTVRDFLGKSAGRGGPSGANRAFVRDDAMLAVVLVTDEDDCSITEAGRVLFDTPMRVGDDDGTSDDVAWGDVPYNLRCGQADGQARDDLLHDVSRYVDGLNSLKPDHPERVVFAGLAGIPLEAEAMLAEGRHDQVLAMKAMKWHVPASGAQRLAPACSVRRAASGHEETAYPARRLLRFASGLGESAALFSICRPSYDDAAAFLVDRYVAQLDET